MVYPNIVITNLWKFGLDWPSKLQKNNIVDIGFRPEVFQIQILNEKLSLFPKLRYLRGSIRSHNVLYYQQLSIACHQVSFYADLYFESNSNVSTQGRSSYVPQNCTSNLTWQAFEKHLCICFSPMTIFGCYRATWRHTKASNPTPLQSSSGGDCNNYLLWNITAAIDFTEHLN